MSRLALALFIVLGVIGLFTTCAIAADNEKTNTSAGPVEAAALAVPKAVVAGTDAAAPAVPGTVKAVSDVTAPIIPPAAEAINATAAPVAQGVSDAAQAAVAPLAPEEKKEEAEPEQ